MSTDHSAAPRPARTYVALRRVSEFAPWTVRGPWPGLRPLGTVVAPSRAAARAAAESRWPDALCGSGLRLQRASALPTAVLVEALAADGADRLRRDA